MGDGKFEKAAVLGSGYERNAAFAGLVCDALCGWWSNDAGEREQGRCREALEALLTYGFSTVEMRSYLPAGAELRCPELDAELAQAKVEQARRLLGGARESAVHALAAPLVESFGFAKGHAELLALWQLSEVYCSLSAYSTKYAQAHAVLTETAQLFDVDSPADVPACLEGIICYLGFMYPEIDGACATRLSAALDADRLAGGLIPIAPEHVETMYSNMRLSDDVLDRVPQRSQLGIWVLTHKLQWQRAHEIQDYSMRILADVDAFCREAGIGYFLCEGALLGAVRDGGPIAWDDDIDIGMLREDYDRFVREAPVYFVGEYTVDTFETNRKHWTISGKVQMVEDTGYISLKTEGLALSNGPFVDIFAFDNSPEGDGSKLVKRGRRISALRALLYYRSGFQKRPSVRKAHRKKVLSMFTPVSYLHKQIDSLCRMYQKRDCKYVSNFGSLYKVEKETFAVDDVLPLRDVAYGNLKASVPNNAEVVLDRIYGDWRTLPPYPARLGKHRFIRREDYEAELQKHIAGA